MKNTLAQLKAGAARGREALARAALLPFVMLASNPVLAALPTVTPPGTGIGGAAVTDGDWLGSMGAWFKAGVGIVALVLVAMGFVYVIMGALGKWRAYSMGRAEMADLKEYMIMAAVLTAFLVLMATIAIKTLE
ncbi:DUF2976 domain-containing protein [Ottowia sp.]|uniref:DUF2976 domain-containing protein n=1 Tax=Ottowia sp. TaxID=1898956 RepID=UPI003A87BFBA